MHDLSGVAGLGWNGRGGSRELLYTLHLGCKLLRTSRREQQRSFRTPTAIENHDGGGRLLDQCGRGCGDRHLSDAELEQWAVVSEGSRGDCSRIFHY